MALIVWVYIIFNKVGPVWQYRRLPGLSTQSHFEELGIE